MSRWPSVSLGEIFDIARGGSPRPIDQFITDDPDGINWIMIGDAPSGSKYITGTKKRIKRSGASRSRFVKPGDFLLTNSMSFGRPYILQTAGCIHDGWLVLSPRQAKVSSDYLYHLLGSEGVYSEFSRLAAGATVKNLNIDLVSSVKIGLPPFPEQRRIAAILDQADALRAKRRAALARLDEMVRAIFEEMFGEVRTNAHRWPLVPVSHYVSAFQGGRSLEADGDDKTAAYRVLKVSAVTSTIFCPTESKPLPFGYEPPTEHFVRPGDLLFSRANTTELVGAVAYVEETPRNLVLPDKLWRFVWRQPAVAEPLFIWAMFQTPAIREEVGRRATGTSGSMKNISQSKLLTMSTILPPLPLQQQFAKRLRAAQKLMRYQQHYLEKQDALFSSLQHRAFRGEL